MVKLTIIGRVSDGLPLAQGPRYVNEERNDNFSAYKLQGEFILQEISRGSLPLSNMTIRVDHHCFNYVVENGVCFITLCDSSYPQKLVRFFLQDLATEFDKFGRSLAERITKPYSFVGFGSVIGNIRRQYVDTRTQANLSKLNAKCQPNEDFLTEDFSQIVKRRRRAELMERLTETPQQASQIWGSKKLEIIALRWTPITILGVFGAILLWSRFTMRDDW
ncbi:OLC1v1027390C1 [Oldenlandia corymbosa var. corymbosa]|uniref:OLC1v1027390C1 n=1 Tax=Oldenlandia corymbosa var. corymbosa TaxID=529605 RepID=A0AAV1C9C8_OLDCO|nr:OLC1v1027390C1 [Oldenlandia corymbosa var. corymbosa]